MPHRPGKGSTRCERGKTHCTQTHGHKHTPTQTHGCKHMHMHSEANQFTRRAHTRTHPTACSTCLQGSFPAVVCMTIPSSNLPFCCTNTSLSYCMMSPLCV